MAATLFMKPTPTPPSYHRIISPSVIIPSDPTVPIPVGILACQRDPLLRSLETVVVSSVLFQSSQSSSDSKAKKAGKKAVLAPALPDGPILQVILHDTVIFPEGGGQPTDTGIITTKGDGITWQVIQAKRHGGHAVHYVHVPSSDIDSALRALTPGTEVIVALGEEGYHRRYDHMSMHTSQHLLSALLETRLNLPTLSWSLTGYPSPCYVEVPRGMTADEILSVQNKANSLVFEGRQVHIEVEELDQEQEGTKEVPKTNGGRAIGKALPEDYTGGVKRVVVIEGVDRNPCCGTHLPSIHNLQLFLLPHTESLSRSSTTNARLYFLAGPRLVDHLTSTHSLLTQAAATLSCGAPLVPERLGQVVEERKKAEKRLNEVEIELAGYIARDLAQHIPKETQDLFVHHLHRTEDTANPLVFLSAVASSVANLAAKDFPSKKFLFVLSSSPSSQSASTSSTVLAFGSDEKIVKDVGDALKAKLAVRGGGKGPRWSGKLVGVWKDDKEGYLLKEVLDKLRGSP